ncbi:MAG: substrate-binding domain-containing protein, partial [Solirubrobacteraceae bacterium]
MSNADLTHQAFPALTRRGALTGGAAGAAALLLSACGGSGGPTATTGSDASATATTGTIATGTDAPETPGATAAAVFGTQRVFRFAVINDALQSAGSRPTQNGADDACQLLGCSYDWHGSTHGDVDAMVAAMEDAIRARVDGLAVMLSDRTAFDPPLQAALRAQIPVVAYGADAPGSGS